MKNSTISTVKTQKTNMSGQKTETQKTIKQIILSIGYFIASVFISRGTVFGLYAPFGLAFCTAVPYENLWSAVAGATIGYLLPVGINSSMRYVSTLLSIAAIRWTLSDFAVVRKSQFYLPIISFIPTLATGIAMNTVDGVTPLGIIKSIVEAILCGVSTYFISRSIDMVENLKSISFLSQTEFTCLFMTSCIFILSLTNVTFGNLSLGRIIIIISILLCSRFAGVTGGAISGTSSGIIFSFAFPELSYIMGSYSLGGLMSGFFSPFGRTAVVVSFIVSNIVIAMQFGQMSIAMQGIYEVFLATVIFMLLPQKILNYISRLFYVPQDSSRSEGLRRSMIIRLNFIGKSLCSVADSVDAVSEKLEKLNIKDSSNIYKNVTEKICSKCGMRAFCWKKEFESTQKVFDTVNEELLSVSKINAEAFPEEFIRRCCKIGEITSEMNKSYEEFMMNEISRRRVNEIRCVVSEQFSSMGQILSNMAKEFDKFEYFDLLSARKITEKLRALNIVPIDAVCRVDKFGRMCVEVETAYVDKKVFDNIDVSKTLSDSLGRTFDTPSIIFAPDRCRIQLSERPIYQVDIGSSQHICNNGTLCGDSYSYFNDGSGRMIVILCDGMGTGGRAAVDGAMASDIMSRLVKAGLSFESALKIVNSALFIKSSDESLATIDIVCIDLFTGNVEIMKAGAPITIIRKNNKIPIQFNTSSLPAGILMDIKFARESSGVSDGDWILMVSDGALALGEDFLKNELSSWQNDNPQEFAQCLVNKIVKDRDDGYDDDITAVAIKLSKV